jgi:hypothetical protein
VSKGSGVTGKTLYQLARAQAAARREADRAERTPDQQLALLDTRPGNSARERARLTHE